MKSCPKHLSGPLLAGFIATAALGVAGPAFAHAHLVSSAPAAGSVSSGPEELRLTFSEPIELAFTKVTLTGPDKEEMEVGKPGLDPADKKVVTVPVGAPLTPGAFTVGWTVVSGDGHKMSGSYSFEVAK